MAHLVSHADAGQRVLGHYYVLQELWNVDFLRGVYRTPETKKKCGKR